MRPLPKTLTAATRAAVRAHGPAACLEAFARRHAGDSALTIAFAGLPRIKTDEAADRAARAGRELHHADYLPDVCWPSVDDAIERAKVAADESWLPVTVARTPETHGWHVLGSLSGRLQHPDTLMTVTVLPARYFVA